MTVDQDLRGPALLLAAAAEVRSRKEISEARGRQVRWAAGEYARALAHGEHPLGEEATACDLLDREAVDAYLELAGRGALRVRQAASPRSGDHSRQIRIEVLALLAKALDVHTDLPPQPDPAPKEPVASRPRSLLRSSLTELADARPGQIRMLAIGATVADTGARAGELCSRGVEDLSPSLEELRIVRRPQGWSEAEAYAELLPLSGLARAALRRWLPERQALMARVGGTATALWVSLHPNHHGDKPVPAGTPLRPRGLARAWTRAVTEANIEMAGEPDWSPLPTRMEQLRRGVTPKASPAPMCPDAERAAVLLDRVAERGADLAALRSAEPDTTAELEARVAARKAVREAWAEGIEHPLQLSALADAGLADDAALAAAGWEPVLLAAIDRAAGWGRAPRKAKAV
jgi:integrase